MGAPAELYENPRSTFVANFLGQSNLIEGTVKSRAADVVTVDMHGIDVSIPADRAHATGDRGWVGIRPEKVLIGDVGEALDAPGNTDPRRRGHRRQLRRREHPVPRPDAVGPGAAGLLAEHRPHPASSDVGEQVELSWRPEYAFLLDAAQDASAGAQRMDADG